MSVPLNLEDKLKQFFGYNKFREHQEQIITQILQEKDVLAILPTGAGKSLCYQLPAMLLPGITIVISPLISLMHDQVVSLVKNGIPAACLNSSLYMRDAHNVIENLSDYKILYVAPERFTDLNFLERLKKTQVSLFAIDEAHCISQWGHSFRLEYRKLALLKEHFPKTPVMALTATATPEVERDIIDQLSMKNPVVIKGSFDRSNLTIRINLKINQETQLLEFLEKQKGKSGIIYTATRKSVDHTWEMLKELGMNVERYHAGMNDQERSLSQNAFIHDKTQLMVATVAFGMGIHKPDIRFIVHLDMPKNIEQYYQEIGRAGRDGLPSECLMLYNAQDKIIYLNFLKDIEDPVIRQNTRLKTNQMFQLCVSNSCRRKEILHYFGEQYFKQTCKTCDNCVDHTEYVDGKEITQKILSCVYRLNHNFGSQMVIDVLRGSKNQKILDRKFDLLSTYGIMTDTSEREIRYYINSLIEMGYLAISAGEYPVLKWTEKSREAISGREEILFRKKIFKEVKESYTAIKYDENIFNELRKLRTQIAQEENVPPYVVFSDRALQEMAFYIPKNSLEFEKINGVGPIKKEKFGDRFLSLLSLYSKKQNFEPVPVRHSVTRKKSSEETIELFLGGHKAEEISQMRHLTMGTVISHLEEGIREGILIDISSIVSDEKRKEIEEVIARVGGDKLTPIKQALPQEITYDEIRLVAAIQKLRKN